MPFQLQQTVKACRRNSFGGVCGRDWSRIKIGEEGRRSRQENAMVELSGIEPLASSLRIQGVNSDGVKPKNTK